MDRLGQIRGRLPRSWYATAATATFALLLLLWQAAAQFAWVSPVFLPPPGRVLAELLEQLASPDLWKDTGTSIFRVMGGFVVSAHLGIPLGILAGTFPAADAVIAPVNEFVRYMPASAFIPLVMVWVGIGETAKMLIIFIGCFFQLVLMVADNTRSVSMDLIHSAYTLGATRWQVIRRVLLPAMMPALVDTLRLMLGWAWTYLVVAELIASNSGLGYRILKAQRFLRTDTIFIGILVIGLLGLVTDRLFRYANRRLFPWAEGGS